MAVFIEGLKRINKKRHQRSQTQNAFNSSTIAPTTHHPKITLKADDYQQKPSKKKRLEPFNGRPPVPVVTLPLDINDKPHTDSEFQDI
jgi:hypothetical protein